MAAGVIASPGASAAQGRGAWVYAVERAGGTPSTPPELRLLQLDARTLSVRRRQAFTRDWYVWVPVRSPDGRMLAAAGLMKVRVFELANLRATTVDLSGLYVSNLAWVSPDQLVVLGYRGGENTHRLVWIDVRSATVVRTFQLPGVATGFVRGRNHAFVKVNAGPRWSGSWRILGGPRGIFRVDAQSATLVAVVGNLRLGLEPWRVRRNATLPPLAAESLRLAREDLARRENVDVRAVEPVSVVAAASTWILRMSGYRVVLRARGRLVVYWMTFDETRPRLGPAPPPQPWTDSQPELKEHDLLRFRAGTAIALDERVVASRDRKTLYFVTPNRILGVFSVAKRGFAIKAAHAGGDFGSEPTLVGEATVAWQNEERGMVFLDVRTGRVRIRGVTRCHHQEPASKVVIAYGFSTCSGVTALGPDGRVRFRLLRGRSIGRVQATDRYAYATLSVTQAFGDEFAVIDLGRGKVVRTVRFPRGTALLVGSFRPG